MSRLTNWFNQQIRFHPGSPPEVQSEFISIRLESPSSNAYSIHSSTQHNAERLLKHIEGVYRWLPLGTIVNNRVLVVHGGISDSTDLDLIRSLDRGKYVSLLRPPGTENIDKVEWKQVSNVVIVKEWRMPFIRAKIGFLITFHQWCEIYTFMRVDAFTLLARYVFSAFIYWVFSKKKIVFLFAHEHLSIDRDEGAEFRVDWQAVEEENWRRRFQLNLICQMESNGGA